MEEEGEGVSNEPHSESKSHPVVVLLEAAGARAGDTVLAVGEEPRPVTQVNHKRKIIVHRAKVVHSPLVDCFEPNFIPLLCCLFSGSRLVCECECKYWSNDW